MSVWCAFKCKSRRSAGGAGDWSVGKPGGGGKNGELEAASSYQPLLTSLGSFGGPSVPELLGQVSPL
jgi:hypothetical protein